MLKGTPRNVSALLPKIRNSVLKSCDKKPVTLEQIEGCLEEILKDLKEVEGTTIPTGVVGRIVLKNLKDLDEIAFLRFAIVHNNYGCMKNVSFTHFERT
jgi:transcriptional repressor NrdR